DLFGVVAAVEAGHFMPAFAQAAAQGLAEEAATAGYEDFHAGILCRGDQVAASTPRSAPDEPRLRCRSDVSRDFLAAPDRREIATYVAPTTARAVSLPREPASRGRSLRCVGCRPGSACGAGAARCPRCADAARQSRATRVRSAAIRWTPRLPPVPHIAPAVAHHARRLQPAQSAAPAGAR